MLRFILQRILITIPLLFSVGVLAFLLVDLIPGSPAVVMLQDAATPENVAILEEQMGLNDPILERSYFNSIYCNDCWGFGCS